MGTHTTTQYGFIVPLGNDLISNGDDLQRTWADKLDQIMASAYKGVTATARPAAGINGRFWYGTDDTTLWFDNGTAWIQVTKVARTRDRTFTMDDSTAPPSTALPMDLGVAWLNGGTGETIKLTKAQHRIASGTSVSWKLQRATAAGAFADVTGWGTTASPIVTTSTSPQGATLDPADVTLASGDALTIVVIAVAGTPKGFSVNLVTETA